MATSNESREPPNFQTELAKERNRIAADRTLLSWSRTGVSLIATGFGVERVISKLYADVDIDSLTPIILVKIFSVLIVGTGTFSIIMAALDYQREMKRLQQAEYYYTPRKSLGIIVSGILVIIAISAFIIIWRQVII